MAVGSLATLCLAILFLGRWVNSPLAALSRSLESDSPAPLAKLGGQENEFGQMALLFSRFFEQKAQLASEVEEHARSRAALERSERRFNLIFDNAPIGLLALDGELRISHLNISIQRMFGYLRRDLEREHISMLIHPEDLDRCLQSYAEICEKGRLFSRTEMRYLDKDGFEVRGRQTDVAIRSPEGEFLFVVSMIEELEHATAGARPSGA
jgi:PAS domain S-box-containing protein